MKILRFHYHMDISFDSSICDHRFTLKCIPRTDENQTIRQLMVDVYPNQFIRTGFDSFHNKTIYGYSKEEHHQFYIDVLGIAQIELDAPKVFEDIYSVGLYKYHTALTIPGAKLRAYFSIMKLEDKPSNYDKALYMMQELFATYSYVQGVTSVETTAEHAFALGGGVCQDYSHILLSLCRMARIPCRYVVGLLMGEGYSHAWVEIFQVDETNTEQGYWIALDPTNNLVISDQHIKISNGRDSNDCKINQGLFTGTCNQIQTISVIVYECNEHNRNKLTEGNYD